MKYIEAFNYAPILAIAILLLTSSVVTALITYSLTRRTKRTELHILKLDSLAKGLKLHEDVLNSVSRELENCQKDREKYRKENEKHHNKINKLIVEVIKLNSQIKNGIK